MAVYSTGSVTVTNASAAVVGSGTAWVGQVKVGDTFYCGIYAMVVAAIADNTHLTLQAVWPGSTLASQSYYVNHTGADWFSTVTTNESVQELIATLEANQYVLANGGAYNTEISVAAAATTDVLGAASYFVAITGTGGPITSFGSAANEIRYCRAAAGAAFTITHNAVSLICPQGASVSVVAGDTWVVVSDSVGNARIFFYQRASGLAIIAGLLTLAETIKVADYTVTTADSGKPIIANKATAIVFTLPAVASAGILPYTFRNIGAGDLTLDPNSTELIEGASTLVLSNGDSAIVWPNGTAWRALVVPANSTAAEVTVASAGTTDILGAASPMVAISGTTTITSLGAGINRRRFVRFTGALTLTHNATSLILPGAANILTEAGDTMIVESDISSNVRVLAYQRVAPSRRLGAEVTVASAGTTDILGAASDMVAISGTTTITSLGTGPNRVKYVRFTGILTLTHNATSLILPGAANIVTAAGDTAIIESDASSNVRVLAYVRADGSVVLPNTGLRVYDTNASHVLIFAPGSDLTANRTLNIFTGDADRNLDLGASTPFTPTVAAGTGTITTVGACSGNYIRFGKLVWITMTIAITTNGTGGANVQVTNLPFTVANRTAPGNINGHENSITGKMVLGICIGNTTTVAFNYYDGSYPGANGMSLRVSGWFETT